ncbi:MULTISPECIES: diaminopimelate decarboxylase [unclassified Duganella]|uniref:diaminopimelate decarboxylase n=1 Tax=unclassified Duganella TaxID=2636909 RepID=UPI000E34C144|nr:MULTISPECIES: diaminopimelate decarboxylase [unclassified Duganella]RFP10164.1 diaminopimelate decarboxylase [Duganella sp. BJB475]RFP25530.1 diaminopimelate decarboxylase [Duganella sp. BJB476]
MSQFSYVNGVLHAEGASLAAIAEQFGTPTYVYSKAQLLTNFASYADACAGRDALVCYAMKANSNLAILDLLARQGAGFDIVSGGELLRVLAAGGDPRKVIFSGVGKSVDEMRLALSHDILCFNVESIPELHRLNEVAGSMGKTARVSLRVNPNVDAKTHPYIATGLKANKFGVAFDDALDTYRAAARLPHLEVAGIDCHIGSQLLDDAPLLEALDRLIELIDKLGDEGIVLHHLDIGGGIGINYGEAGEAAPVPVGDYLGRLFAKIDAWRAARYAGKPIKVIFEPGRSIVGDTGVLLTKVEFIKHGEEKNFCVVDAAMNDMARPALYQAWMDMQPVVQGKAGALTYDVVGPICESGDWLARDRELAVEAGDLLVMHSAGAYGMTMASNYNTRGRAAEIIVDGEVCHVVRKRENPADLYALESLIK